MAATAKVDSQRKDSDLISYKMGAVKIYKGTLVVVRADGYAYPARNSTATDVFIGVAYETVDNSAGAAGDKEVLVQTTGTFVFAKTTAVIADVGLAHYASDDQTIYQTSANNQLVGYAVGLEDTGHLRIRIDTAVK
jgi:hypothetical protein